MNMIPRTNAELGRVPSVACLDWTRDAFWVSRDDILDVQGDASADPVTLAPEGGASVRISRRELLSSYAEIEPGKWRSRFLPVRAILARQEGHWDLGEGVIVYAQPGDAFIQNDGAFRHCSAADFDAGYNVVGHRGAAKPLFPFSYAAP